ncbi:hypothetical protein Y032_0375g225 [Ancylostoma ceylanicum]|uniref:Uncharacterized protein n=1 Tax=Ancylostoma ceylanicum TaxID=53326 RepID=A0A016RTS7_9BILA|nr:hypothetical protein Y032_0375g225 [Ancylostoma ceylanicum]
MGIPENQSCSVERQVFCFQPTFNPLSCCIRPLDIAYSQLLTQRRWRRSDGYNTRDATCSEAVALRGCAMPKFAKLRIRRITHLARFGVSVNVHAL